MISNSPLDWIRVAKSFHTKSKRIWILDPRIYGIRTIYPYCTWPSWSGQTGDIVPAFWAAHKCQPELYEYLINRIAKNDPGCLHNHAIFGIAYILVRSKTINTVEYNKYLKILIIWLKLAIDYPDIPVFRNDNGYIFIRMPFVRIIMK